MNVTKVLDPQLDVRHDLAKNHLAFVGPERKTFNVTTSSNFGGAVGTANPGQCSFEVQPPKSNTLVSREVSTRFFLHIETTGDFDVNNAAIGTSSIFRQFPIASVTDSIQLSINGESISDNVAQKVHPLLCYGNNEIDRMKHWSRTPSAPDVYQLYDDDAKFGAARSPLGQYMSTFEGSRAFFVTNRSVFVLY